ncbi:MAG: polyprenyl diphosphate synthase [Planctomycetota bacterium]|nr:polyprenyl diphosphate synthase [Planctomycetota bacterium]
MSSGTPSASDDRSGDGRSGDRLLPRHVAFIMDGNGRWSKARGRLRIHGHARGADSLREITRYCRRRGIREVTFYALSAENFQRRPASEVRFLMRLLKRFLVQERSELTDNGVRLAVIGDVAALPADVRRELDETLRLTAGLDSMVMRLALNYGSRQEILRAVRGLVRDVLAGKVTVGDVDALDEALFGNYLDDPSMPDPDLVIRTAGEFRLSNFLLWQSSYSELWITDRLWPDFSTDDLEAALEAYVARDRRYGAAAAAAAAGGGTRVPERRGAGGVNAAQSNTA